MKVHILAFGIAKDLIGTGSTQIEMEKGKSIADLRQLLEKRFPELKKLGTYMIAQNSKYTNGNERIEAQDEIAIIPPVSGG